MFFKSKNKTSKEEKQTMNSLVKWILKNWERSKNFSFSKKDFSYFKRKIKKSKQNTLMNFWSFLEKMLIILLNNQYKSWFNFKKWLLFLDTKKYTIYKKVYFIENPNFLKIFLNDVYKKYDFLFENVTVYQSIHNLKVAKQLYDIDKRYEWITTWIFKWFNGPVWIACQTIVIILFGTLSVFWMIAKSWTTDIFKFYMLTYIDQLQLALFMPLVYFWNNMIFWIWMIILIWLLVWIWNLIWWLTRYIFEYFRKNFSRDVDLYYNEITLSYIIIKNIENLKIDNNITKKENDNTNKYLYVNFENFYVWNLIEANKRWFIQNKFLKWYLHFFNYYLKFNKEIKSKNMKLSEWFKNITTDILTWYKSSMNTSNEWFSLWFVQNRLNEYIKEIWNLLFDLEEKKRMWKNVNFIFIWMGISIALTVLISSQQWFEMMNLVWK